MKHIILSLALIFTITLTAQDPIVKEVGEFTALKVYDLSLGRSYELGKKYSESILGFMYQDDLSGITIKSEY